MKLRWFPNSWVLVEAASKVVYIDPAWIQKNFLKYPGHVVYSHWPDPMDGLPDPELHKADYIFVSHAHQDHYKAVTIARLRKASTRVFGPATLVGKVDGVEIVEPGAQLRLEGVHVEVVHAYNTPEGRSTSKQHKRGESVGFVVEAGGRRLYHAGDTDVIPEMRDLGGIDVAMLPVGGTFTMDAQEAVEAARIINPRLVVPMHFMGADPTVFMRLLAEAGLDGRLLETGGCLEI